MAPTILIFAGGLANDELGAALGRAAAGVAACLLADTVAVARRVRWARVTILAAPGLPPEALAGLPPGVAVRPIAGAAAADLRAALANGCAGGDPALLIGAELPHLPAARLRDALTYLGAGADAVLGPGDAGDWYLLGLRAPAPGLLRLIPGRDEAPARLARGAAGLGCRLVTLPPWFSVRTMAGLAGLGVALRTMPPPVAPATRALLETGEGAARAVGG